MEVLEHIPAEFETIVLDNIDRAARHGVVLSWAVPGQGGFHHINNRSPAYANQTMFNRGLKMDVHASRALREQEAQLMLTTGSTRLAVSRGQQTWYHSTCYI